MIRIKRAYEPFEKRDGYRVLVDRLWPRGMKKSALKIDEWLKEIAPSAKLRKSFSHDPKKWPDFRREYRSELRTASAREQLDRLARLGRKKTITLVYGAKDEKHNDAVVLKNLLDRKLRNRKVKRLS